MKIAHASDLHLLSLKGASWLDFANKRWIGGLNLLTNRGRHYLTEIFERLIDDINESDVDHLVITGDVTNLALDEEFRFAKELFGRFRLSPKDITVLPGNHDAYIQKGSTHFTTHFGDYFSSDKDFQWKDKDPWPIVRVRGNIALVGISTSLKTPWFTAYGKVGDKQLGRLAEVLMDERLAGLSRVVAIHHPPAGKPSKSRVRGLLDRQHFADVIRRAGCELVLHGHEHRDIRNSLDGPLHRVEVRGIQSATYDAGAKSGKKRARYRIYDVKEKTSLGLKSSEIMRAWNSESRRFEAAR